MRHQRGFGVPEDKAQENFTDPDRRSMQRAGGDFDPGANAQTAVVQTDEGKAACRQRRWIAEPPDGWIKRVLGFWRFSMRGPHRVQAGWKPVCAALNLRRMADISAK